MSSRVIFSRTITAPVRRGFAARLLHHRTNYPTGSLPLLRVDSGALRRRPFGSNALARNGASVRSVSFMRALPKLFSKLFRIPAMFGGAMIGSVAYIQYQATQAGTYAVDVFKQGTEKANDAIGSLWGGAKSVADRTSKGWERTKDELEIPEWMQRIFQPGEGGSSGSQPPPEGGDPKQAGSGLGLGATGVALGYSQTDDDERSEHQTAKDDQIMVLTKKMIEIRSILQTVGQSKTLTLPSIVVIGSQSSGKSSVLESIVGHEFLPKGSNMVTRRPIELTLVNTPEAKAEYGEFPALGLGKITDFSHIQKTLTDLNLAVPEADCVTDDPIQLSIYSPFVPDLSLIDLPGYIQVTGRDQPEELQRKIKSLCDKYIQPPNVILAVSSADVDLANSTSLRACRRVDPRGERTIGVVTKMDLVDPERGSAILNDRNYPLRLGYVGVVSKIPQTSGLFSRGNGNIMGAIAKNENAYFSAHPSEFGPNSSTIVGTSNLRRKLLQVLERTMAASLQGTTETIRQELDDATYEFKVQYNERPLSAETYLAESLDAFKHSFKQFSQSFGKPEVRDLLKQELDQRVLDLMAQRYWNKPIPDLSKPLPEIDPLSGLSKADPNNLHWLKKLDASTTSLTKLGIGRLATTAVSNVIQAHIDHLVESSSFAAHPFARQAITEASARILNDRFYSTSDQVENCIKPYKYDIEVDDAEWSKGRESVMVSLKQELKAVDAATARAEESAGGRRKLKDVMSFIEKVRRGDIVVEGEGQLGAGGFSAALLAKGREAVFLRDRSDIIKMRMMAVKSKQCAKRKNKYQCPEVFLDVVADKLTSTAVLFLNVELLSDFYYNFPRELDLRLGNHLSASEVERFAREDPKVRKHLDVVKRKDTLELVLKKIESLSELEAQERKPNFDGSGARRKGWGLF